MNQNTVVPAVPKRELIAIQEAIPLFDTAVFDHMLRVATRMAASTIIPDHLRIAGDFEATVGNCLLVINQARNWGMDPFAVAQCMSIVHGKPCYEGKLIAAAIETKLGIRLNYEWFGEPGSDGYGIRIWDIDQVNHRIEGTVGDWKTKDKEGRVKANWATPNAQYRQLKYRGDREWARLWAPSLMLGVYSDDEMEDLREDARARRATPVGPGLADRFRGETTGDRGFSAEHVRRETGAEVIDPQTGEVIEIGKPSPAQQSSAGGNGSAEDNSNPGGEDVTASETAKGSNAPKAEVSSVAAQADGGLNAGGDSAAYSPGPNDSTPPADAADRGASEVDAPAGEAGATTSRAASPKIRISADLVRGYSDALYRGEQIRSLSKLKTQYLSGKNARDFDDQSVEWLKTVYDIHSRRCAGEFEAAVVDRMIVELVKEIDASAGTSA